MQPDPPDTVVILTKQKTIFTTLDYNFNTKERHSQNKVYGWNLSQLKSSNMFNPFYHKQSKLLRFIFQCELMLSFAGSLCFPLFFLLSEMGNRLFGDHFVQPLAE